jgi:hypothetical protein
MKMTLKMLSRTLANFIPPRSQEGSASLEPAEEAAGFDCFLAGPLSSGPESDSESDSFLDLFLSFGIVAIGKFVTGFVATTGKRLKVKKGKRCVVVF